MTAGIVLIIVGLLVGLGAFAFAGKNMVSMTKDPFGDSGLMEKGMGKHVGAMLAMAGGGVISLIGILLLVLALIEKYAG